jgi:5'-nucleotidase
MLKFRDFIDEKVHIYCDMDDTLCDFSEQFKRYSGGSSIEKLRDDGENVYAIMNSSTKFWSEMPWLKDGKDLWNFIKKYEPMILTKPTNSSKCIDGKLEWCKRELGYSKNKIIFEPDKEKYAHSKRDILIDDSEEHITKWIKSGGTGILRRRNRTQEVILEIVETIKAI